MTNSLSIYKQYCPGCKITLKTITASTNSLLASATSANMLANPNATYYYTEFEDSLDPTVQGIQQSPQDGHLAVGRGRLGGWPRAAQERLPVKAVVTVDQAYAGWALTDEILRMATKSPAGDGDVPRRGFSPPRTSVASRSRPRPQNSGAWFGDTSYQSEFEKLWGV